MNVLAQLFISIVVLLYLPIFLLSRLLGLRPPGQSVLDPAMRARASFAIVNTEQAKTQPYPYVQVNDDGTARELRPSQRQDLETPFFGADSGRPYVKWRYRQKNGWGELGGYLKRSKLPKHITVAPAGLEPAETAESEWIRRARERGCDILENPDGSRTILPNRMFQSLD